MQAVLFQGTTERWVFLSVSSILSNGILKTSLRTLWGFIFCCCVFLWPHLWHTQVPRLGAESELPEAYTTASETLDLSWRILNPMRSKINPHPQRDSIGFLTYWVTNRNSKHSLLYSDRSHCLSELGVLEAHSSGGNLKRWGPDVGFQPFSPQGGAGSCKFLPDCMLLSQGWGLHWDCTQPFLLTSVWVFSQLIYRNCSVSFRISFGRNCCV